MLIHTGDWPFVCHYEGCDKSYSWSGRLKIHLRVHVSHFIIRLVKNHMFAKSVKRDLQKEEIWKLMNEFTQANVPISATYVQKHLQHKGIFQITVNDIKRNQKSCYKLNTPTYKSLLTCKIEFLKFWKEKLNRWKKLKSNKNLKT